MNEVIEMKDEKQDITFDFISRQSGKTTRFCIGLIHETMTSIGKWQEVGGHDHMKTQWHDRHYDHWQARFIIDRCRYLIDNMGLIGFHFKQNAIMYNGKRLNIGSC